MQKTGARLIASKTAVEIAIAAGVPIAKTDGVTAGDVRARWSMENSCSACNARSRFSNRRSISRQSETPGAPQRASDWVCGEPLSFLIEANGKRIYIDSGGRP